MPATTLADTAYAALRSQITTLQIRPGVAFTEGRIAAELGLSKTPVREALTRLRFEGLVTVDPKVGYRAAPVTIKYTREFFAIRTLLEGEAARLAASQAVDEDQLRALDDLCTSSYSPSDAASVDRFLAANTKFHIMIGRAGGNDRLTGMLEVMLVEMERLFRIGLLLSSRANEIVHEHRDLVNAIMAGDERAARQLAVAQVRTSQKMVLDALIASSDVTTTPIGLSNLQE
jgi:DNA-binding GntR family transcriptional regulator